MPDELAFVRIHESYSFKSFDCGDTDLNEFIINDSKPYLRELMAVTYVLESESCISAFFSLLNDKISIEEVQSKNRLKKIAKLVSYPKRNYKSFPAVKLGRLGVNLTTQNQGMGKAILDYLKIWFTEGNKTGCRFITVDAYSKSINFYQKNGFHFLLSDQPDPASETVLMYYDLCQVT